MPDPAGDGLGCAGLDKDERVRVVSIYALKGRFQDLLRPAVGALYRLGVTANTVTVAAAPVSCTTLFTNASSSRHFAQPVPRIWINISGLLRLFLAAAVDLAGDDVADFA